MFIIGVAIAAGLAGASIGAGIAGSAASAVMSNKQARRNRRFQERMAKTKYQYTMEDMKKAGLNPILAYKQGAGGTPGGAMAPVPMDIGSTAAKGVSEGPKGAVALVQRKLMGEQTSAARAQAAASNASAENQLAESRLRKAELAPALVRSEFATTPGGQAAIEAQMRMGKGGTIPSLISGGLSAGASAMDEVKRMKKLNETKAQQFLYRHQNKHPSGKPRGRERWQRVKGGKNYKKGRK